MMHSGSENKLTEITKIPFGWAKQHGALICEDQGALCVTCREDVEISVLMEVQRHFPGISRLNRVKKSVFEQSLTEIYQESAGQTERVMANIGNDFDFYTLAQEMPENVDLLDSSDDAPIIKLINAMLGEAIKESASDVHIEPFEKRLIIRFRVDGLLHTVLEPQRLLASLLVSRIKVMARLDIAEKRIPQDGRIALRIGGRAVDVRVSTLPTQYGERVVMRLLDKNNARLNLSHSGMSSACKKVLTQLVHQPHGLILVTGPTGSGKSTTLYSALNEIDSGVRNIMTVEDPIEYELEGIGQTQVNTRVDMTFARGLRALLRQDPDVVLVGEIRDQETAQVAVQASMTGHLVLSTLHTNTAVGAITRLQDMGIEPFLLSSTLAGVMSQRLVRTLCLECRKETAATEEEKLLAGSGETGLTLFRAVGCEQCKQTGYRGRMGIHELIILNQPLRTAIIDGKSEQEIEALAHQSCMTLRQDGIEKVLAGLTTLEEVFRVIREA